MSYRYLRLAGLAIVPFALLIPARAASKLPPPASVQIDFNPVFERVLHGPGTREGWNFEPALRIGYEANKHFVPSLEYYSAAGPLPDFLPLNDQIHIFLPGADFHFGAGVGATLGVGVGDFTFAIASSSSFFSSGKMGPAWAATIYSWAAGVWFSSRRSTAA